MDKYLISALIFLLTFVTISAQDYYFVNVKNGLNMRNSGDLSAKKIAKIPYGVMLRKIEETPNEINIKDNGKLITGRFVKIKNGLTFKKFTILGTTNFDNFKEQKFLTKREAEVLKIDEIYADFNTSPNFYKIVPFYKIDFSKDFHSIVFVVFLGDTQMNSILVNYSKTQKIIDFTVVAYDEIAERWSKTTSRITNNIITTFEVLHTDEVQVIQKKYLVNFDGKLKEIDRKNLHETIKNFPFVFNVLNVYSVDITKVKRIF